MVQEVVGSSPIFHPKKPSGRAFFMLFDVYILYSDFSGKFYKGQTSDLDDRIIRHNAGYEKSTASGRPWKLVWSRNLNSRREALQLERKLKNLSRRRLIQFMTKYASGLSKDGKDLIQQFEP